MGLRPGYCFLLVFFVSLSINVFGQYSYTGIRCSAGKYRYTYNQVPDNLVSLTVAVSGTTFQWEQSLKPVTEFAVIYGATQQGYSFSGPLTQTTYFRRQAYLNGSYSYSNTIKIEVVSVNWEDINYIREHDVLVAAVTDWQVVDNLPVGQKLQTTTYLDGLGRPLEKISRETATPAQEAGLWGDMVQFYKFDEFERQPLQYLPYTTTTSSGKYKMSPLVEQPAYYISHYGETAAYSAVSYDHSPLNRVTNVKSPGTSWAAGAGNTQGYDLNDVTDNVQNFTVGYNTGDVPVSLGPYGAGTLFKTTHTDENGKQVIEYMSNSGQVILTKTQVDDNPTQGHSGWICVYSVYNDFGLLRYRIQPEGVKYLDSHNWSFAGIDGQKVLTDLCFRYDYDAKGRNIAKKAPGAKDLRMLYDSRDRVVFMQDGNQALKSPPEWTANLYDELDKPVITTLYRTTKTVAQLQADIDNAITHTTVTIINPNQALSDLVVDNRLPITSCYAARNSIEFATGFESLAGDDFVAEIDPTAVQSYTVTTSTYVNPITNTDLNDPSKNTVIKYLFYDDYSYSGAKTFDNNFDNTTAYASSEPGVMPIATSKRVISFVTGMMVRVLGTNTFLTSSLYYDNKGRHIQTIEDNFKSGKDVTTLQYHWDGRLLSSHSKHTTANSGYLNFSILTKNVFDKIGRVTRLMKKYGANDFKTIAAYDLDDMGRLKTKHLDPGYTGSGKNEMESLEYSYNIHNNITGINKDYALKTAGTYDKWGNFFGLYLGYDNRDNVFNAGKLDGHVTGLLWNTQGDDAQRKYDYTYDNAGRLSRADFKQRQTTGSSWDNAKIDFTVSGSNGKIEYDLNGNLQSMLQKGVVPGGTAAVTIDDLHYSYESYSNKLITVTDNSSLGTTNGQFGDFSNKRTGNNSSYATDYVYDDNGNVVVDLNKNAKELSAVAGANGIRYNFLDKPEEIHITGKGTINVTYDANGNKLQKKYTPENTAIAATTTTYIGEFVYQQDALSYINFEEGRIRVMTPVSQSNDFDALLIDGNMLLANNNKGVYDYYIRDYQQNVRMILTEQIHMGSNTCSMEPVRSANEEPIFGQPGPNNEVVQTRFAKPVAWQSNTSNYVSKLTALTKKVGPNVLLKVMAGDQISAIAKYYYQNPVTNGTGNNLSSDIITSLIQSILGSPATTGLAKSNTANINSGLSVDPGFLNATDPGANDPTGTNPKAYLSVVFFDERFNFVSEGSNATRVLQPGDGAPLLVLAGIRSPKNGYAYVYLSNESNEPVYFDSLKVGDTRGRIIEEDHYYAYGLKITGISSKKLPDINEGNIDNHNLYNDKELFEEADLNWYDYGFRNYDPQIGRFPQLDPLTDDYPELTNYQYASNDPIANIDLDGLEGVPTVGGMMWNGSFLQQMSASVAANGITRTIVSNVVRVAANIARQEIGQQIINQAFERETKTIFGSVLKDASLLINLTLKPIETGQELTPEQSNKRLGFPQPAPIPLHKFNPPLNRKHNDGDDYASVRFQVQTGKHNISSNIEVNSNEIGVTKQQGHLALGIVSLRLSAWGS